MPSLVASAVTDNGVPSASSMFLYYVGKSLCTGVCTGLCSYTPHVITTP